MVVAMTTGTESTNPVADIRAAAKLLKTRADAATPGPWERPLDVRSKSVIIAALPADEEPRKWRDGTIPADAASWGGPIGRYAGQRERVCVASVPSNTATGFDRKRSGRDLEYIALMCPVVGAALAVWLDAAAQAWDEGIQWDEALDVARALLGAERTDA